MPDVPEPADVTPVFPPGLSLRCPHCLSQVALAADSPPAELHCPECGSTSALAADVTQGWSSPGEESSELRTVGHFRLLRKLGAGGFGEVWKARDLKLDRIVAVKLPHRSLLEADEREKFLREARASAQLRHPHIVSVHDAVQEGDLIYIVSEFIDGLPLDAWLARQRPAQREAAALGVKIADALDHAHQQGIVHRDLKPSNIMMDCEGQPHLMDFGLAKREAGEVTMTLEGQVLGTPAYMSPEQAKGQAHEADRRSDVYSLGVILFELLTGERPFRGNLRMLLRQVVEDEPPSPRKFDSRVARDLETITLKCLQKEPAKRYPTAKALSEELGRFLAGVPILARPVGRLERSVRWCRRNPLAVTAIVGLLFGLAALAVAYVRVSGALERTRRTQRDMAQAVDALFTQVSEHTLLNQPGMQPLQRDLLLLARVYYEKLVAESASDPALADELAMAHFRVGLITQQVESPAKALESYRLARQMQTDLLAATPERQDRLKALGDTLNAMGKSLIAERQSDKARQTYAEAIEIRQRLVDLAPQDADFRRTLANAIMNMGIAEMEQKNSAAARQHMDEAQEIRRRLLAESPGDVKTRRDLAVGCHNLVNLLARSRQNAAAEQPLEEACTLLEGVYKADPGDLEAGYQLAVLSRRWADLKCEQGKSMRGEGKAEEGLARYREGFTRYQRARQILEPLAEKNPSVAEYRLAAGEVFLNIAQAENELEHPDAVVEVSDRGEKFLRPIAQAYAGDPRFQKCYRRFLRAVAKHHPDAGRRAEAEQAWQAWQKPDQPRDGR